MMEINNVGKVPAINSVNNLQAALQPTTPTNMDEKSNPMANNQNNGLANMFANTGQKVEAGNVQGQQGLAGMLGNYRSMWQPNSGNNYQVVGGVRNII